MTITKVSYGKTFNLGSYSSERIDMECEITEDESPVMALDSLKDIVEGFHKQNNPHLYQEQEPTIKVYNSDGNPQVEWETKQIENLTQEQKILNLVNQATSIKELEQWKLLTNNPKYPDLKEAYTKKHLELSK